MSNALATNILSKNKELTKLNEVLANLTAAQEINEKTTLELNHVFTLIISSIYNLFFFNFSMQLFRNQYEQHIAPHFMDQMQKMFSNHKSERTKIIGLLQQDYDRYVSLYENVPEG